MARKHNSAISENLSETDSLIHVDYEILNSSIMQSVTFNEYSFVSKRTRPKVHSFSFDESLKDEWWRSFLHGHEIRSDSDHGAITFIDLFASAGGLSLAFAEAARSLGFAPESLFCADLDKSALEIYKTHFNPLFTHVGDVDHLVDVDGLTGIPVSETELPNILINEKLKQVVGEVDVVLAGPPCQGHSSLNNVSRNEDPRNRFYLHPVAIGIALGAKAIVIENVPGVRRDTSEVVERSISLLKQYGYSVTSEVLKAEHLGWPQTRHRYFLVAVKGSHITELSVFSKLLKSPAKPIEWAIYDLLDHEGDDVMSTGSILSQDNKDRIRWLFENDKDHLPDEYRPACHRDKAHTYSSVYGRMKWDKPSGTITTGFSTPGRGRYVHPLRPRTLLPIEAARIQGFPDGYFLNGQSGNRISKTEIIKWVGDAVPAPLGYPAMLCAILGILDNGKIHVEKSLRSVEK
jgi:DNA (cytosine-5)-methyltransferase 1